MAAMQQRQVSPTAQRGAARPPLSPLKLPQSPQRADGLTLPVKRDSLLSAHSGGGSGVYGAMIGRPYSGYPAPRDSGSATPNTTLDGHPPPVLKTAYAQSLLGSTPSGSVAGALYAPVGTAVGGSAPPRRAGSLGGGGAVAGTPSGYRPLNPHQKTYTPPDAAMIYAPATSPRGGAGRRPHFVLPGEASASGTPGSQGPGLPRPRGPSGQAQHALVVPPGAVGAPGSPPLPTRGVEGKRAAPTGYPGLAAQGMSVLGFQCGAPVAARDDIYIGGEFAIPRGARGVVRGPSDDGDRLRVLVDFDVFHTAINVCPDEIVPFLEDEQEQGQGQEPTAIAGGTTHDPTPIGDGSAGAPVTGIDRRGANAPDPAAGATEGSAAAKQAGFLASMARAHEKMLREVYYQKLKRGVNNRKEKQLEQRVRELEALLRANGIDVAREEGDVLAPPQEPAGTGGDADDFAALANPVPHGGASAFENSGFYDRYPEVRPTRGEVQGLREENEALRAKLGELDPEAVATARSPSAGADTNTNTVDDDGGESPSLSPDTAAATSPAADDGADVAPEGDEPAPSESPGASHSASPGSADDDNADVAPEGDAPAPDSPGSDVASVAPEGDAPAPDSPDVAPEGDEAAPESPAGSPPPPRSPESGAEAGDESP